MNTKDVSTLPPLNADMREILGRTCPECGPIGRLLNDVGVYSVPRKIEEEQAATLHWLLTLYFRHGSEWRAHAAEDLGLMMAERDAKKKAPDSALSCRKPDSESATLGKLATGKEGA